MRLISSADMKPLIVNSHAHSHLTLAHCHTHIHPHAHAVKHGSVQDAMPLHDSHLPSDAAFEVPPGRSLLTSFGAGLVDGLAGSAAITLLVLSAIAEPKWALIYLRIFCVGVVLGMMLITAIIGAPFMLISKRMAGIHRGLTLGAGLLSFGFGLFLAYQVAVVDKLFCAAPI
jgi:high-affinity nickel-transport protein